MPTVEEIAPATEQDLTDAQRLDLARAAFERFGHGRLDSIDGKTYLLVDADQFDSLSAALYGGPSDDADEEVDYNDPAWDDDEYRDER